MFFLFFCYYKFHINKYQKFPKNFISLFHIYLHRGGPLSEKNYINFAKGITPPFTCQNDGGEEGGYGRGTYRGGGGRTPYGGMWITFIYPLLYDKLST